MSYKSFVLEGLDIYHNLALALIENDRIRVIQYSKDFSYWIARLSIHGLADSRLIELTAEVYKNTRSAVKILEAIREVLKNLIKKFLYVI